MKLLLLLVAVAIAGAEAGRCNGTKEAAISVHGMGYYNGKYFKLAGCIAGSKQQQRVAALYKIKCRDGLSLVQYVHFDFRNNVSYYAAGRSADEMKCRRVSICAAKALKCMVPQMWPNHRVVANTTLTGARVPVLVHAGSFSKGDVSVKISGLFDNRGVPVLIKKKYQKEGKCAGGALVFHGLRPLQPSYLQVHPACRNAPEEKVSLSEAKRIMKEVVQSVEGEPRPL